MKNKSNNKIMRMYFAIFVASVGSVAAFDRRLPLFADKLESFRGKIDAMLNSSTSSNYEISEEATKASITGCVKTEKALRDAVRKAKINGPNYTNINLCTRSLMMSGKIDLLGIDVSIKWLLIRCVLTQGNCAINGQGRSGFFYGTGANIKIDRVNFVKGYSFEYSPMFFKFSNIQISRSSIQKSAGNVGSIEVVGGDLFRLSDVTFVQNSGQVFNVYVEGVTNSTITTTVFKNNTDLTFTLGVYHVANLKLKDVTFEQNSANSDAAVTANFINVSHISMSGMLFKSNRALPLLYESCNASITNSLFDGNYNSFYESTAVGVVDTKVTFKGVYFVDNILSKYAGDTIGIAYSQVKLIKCTFANNQGTYGSTNSSSIRVYDGYWYDSDNYTNTTLFCSRTKFCDGFPSDETIVDHNFKPFDTPTCTASLDC